MSKYRFVKNSEGGNYSITHVEPELEKETFIAVADDSEKAHFIVTACNAYKEPPQTFLERVEDEEKGLAENIDKLQNFLLGEMKGVAPEQNSLLHIQLAAMRTYRQVLRERLLLFKVKAGSVG